jgi:hypothetical protein
MQRLAMYGTSSDLSAFRNLCTLSVRSPGICPWRCKIKEEISD